MGTYTPDQVPVPVWFDELGLKLGLQRLPEEPLHEYRRRLLFEARDPADPSQRSYIRGVGRKVGALDKPVFEIDLLLDGDDNPLAADPYIEVTGTWLRCYSNYAEGVVDVEIRLNDRDNGYWLSHIATALAASSYFTTSTLDDYSAWLRSSLRYDNNRRFRMEQPLFPSYQNRVPHTHLNEVLFTDRSVFSNEVESNSLVATDGDFYIDYDEGEIFSHLTSSGTCSYIYSEFPYRLYWQSVRTVPLADPDLVYAHKDSLVADDTGVSEPTALSSEGARIQNLILDVHPLGWGE